MGFVVPSDGQGAGPPNDQMVTMYDMFKILVYLVLDLNKEKTGDLKGRHRGDAIGPKTESKGLWV